jgi:hypothetical protein
VDQLVGFEDPNQPATEQLRGALVAVHEHGYQLHDTNDNGCSEHHPPQKDSGGASGIASAHLAYCTSFGLGGEDHQSVGHLALPVEVPHLAASLDL